MEAWYLSNPSSFKRNVFFPIQHRAIQESQRISKNILLNATGFKRGSFPSFLNRTIYKFCIYVAHQLHIYSLKM